jgi:hypothetical protein
MPHKKKEEHARKLKRNLGSGWDSEAQLLDNWHKANISNDEEQEKNEVLIAINFEFLKKEHLKFFCRRRIWQFVKQDAYLSEWMWLTSGSSCTRNDPLEKPVMRMCVSLWYAAQVSLTLCSSFMRSHK